MLSGAENRTGSLRCLWVMIMMTGMVYYYRDALYAFVRLNPKGEIVVEGTSSVFRSAVPDVVVARFPTKISDHLVRL
jgi:hypothetical protein